MKRDLLEELKIARSQNRALGAFNVFSYTSARAVVNAAEDCGCPVMLQTAQYIVEYYGAEALFDMVHPLAEKASVPVFLHLDHCTNSALAEKCINAGWDSVMIDASKQCLDKNIAVTAAVAAIAKKHGVYVEGEIGVIKGAEEDVVSETETAADYPDIVRFVNESGIDLLAPVIGTVHGAYHGEPKLNYNLVERLDRELHIQLVCHGGTGLPEEAFRRLISLGITKINVATALKSANISAARSYIADSVDDPNPVRFENSLYVAIKEAVTEHIKLFRHAV